MIINVLVHACTYIHIYGTWRYGMAGMASCLWLKLLNLRVDACSEMQIVRLVQ